MGEDKEDKQQLIKQLEREISSLKQQVRNLEEKNNTQEIIIDALVEQTKRLRKNGDDCPIEIVSEDAPAQNTAETFNDGSLQLEDTSFMPGVTARDGLVTAKEPEASLVVPIEELTQQIKTVFKPKQKNVDFKSNYSYQRFVEYAEASYEYSLMNKKVFRTKNPLKMFIEANLDKILKYVIENLNQLNLNQICSTFFLINSEIDYSHKLVIVHDCIIEIAQHSKLPYILSALFNNHELKEDVCSVAIKGILFHQCFVDKEVFTDEEILDYLEIIKHNFSLEKPGVSLWQMPISILEPMPMFQLVGGRMGVVNVSIATGFTIRMICHYLDWEYTYNTFIVDNLAPRLKKEKSAVYAYYLGILAVDAYISFGKHESVKTIFQELLSTMGDDSDLSVVCFLIIKQFYEAEASCWLDNNIASLEKRGFSRKFLSEYLLL